MSWLSQLVNGDIDISPDQMGLGMIGALGAMVGGPALFSAGAGLMGGAEAGAGALGFAGAEGGFAGLGGAEAAGGGSSLEALLGGTGGPFSGIEGGQGLGALGYAPEGVAPGTNSGYIADAFSQFGGGQGFGGASGPGAGLPGGPGFGGEAAPFGGASPSDAAAAGSTGPGVTAGGAEGAGQPGFWDKLVGGAKESFWKNPLGIGAAGAGLGMNILRGSQQSPEMKALSGQAAQLNQQQAQLMGYLQKGTLPPGLQQAVQSATSAMKARIISNHARNGMSTDPSQNSALAQELNNVDLQAVSLIAQQGVALMNSGLQAAQISSSLYGMLEKLNQQHAQSTGQAIANFAAALSGGPKINVIGGQGGGMGFAA